MAGRGNNVMLSGQYSYQYGTNYSAFLLFPGDKSTYGRTNVHNSDFNFVSGIFSVAIWIYGANSMSTDNRYHNLLNIGDMSGVCL